MASQQDNERVLHEEVYKITGNVVKIRVIKSMTDSDAWEYLLELFVQEGRLYYNRYIYYNFDNFSDESFIGLHIESIHFDKKHKTPTCVTICFATTDGQVHSMRLDICDRYTQFTINATIHGVKKQIDGLVDEMSELSAKLSKLTAKLGELENLKYTKASLFDF